MSNTIQIKRRVTGLPGAPTTLKNGELAYNELDDNLYYGKGSDVDQNATSIVTVAGPGALSAQAAAADPLALGTATVGTSTLFAREDHVHAMPSLSELNIPTDSVALNGQRITGLADPVDATDAATKQYVESVAQGLDVKASVRVATTENLSALSGLLTVDGQVLVAGDRVLVKDQTATSANGIYVVAAGAWTRATDVDAWDELPGAFTFVEQGTQAGTGWACSVVPTGVLGTDPVAFSQFSGAGTVQAGDGINVTGTMISAVGTADRISVSASGIDIASTYSGQDSITTVGTVTNGTWSATIDGTSIDCGSF